MKAIRRLFSVQRQLRTIESVPPYQGMAATAAGKLDIASIYAMKSGYEIPVLGYGVWLFLEI